MHLMVQMMRIVVLNSYSLHTLLSRQKKRKQDCIMVLSPAYQWLRSILTLLFPHVGDGGNLWQRNSKKQLVMVTFKMVPAMSARFNLIISCNGKKKNNPTDYLNPPS